jgi:hypothetical protein
VSFHNLRRILSLIGCAFDQQADSGTFRAFDMETTCMFSSKQWPFLTEKHFAE